MGDVLDMVTKKPRKFDCQGEAVVDLRPHFKPDTKVADDLEIRMVSAAAALSRCVRWMQEDFGDEYASKCLSNELLRVKYGRK